MIRLARTGLVVLCVVLSGPAVLGQSPATPAPASALTVTVTGSAESAADWAEVNVTVEGRGGAAAEALLGCQEAYDGSIRELVRLGLDPKSIRCTPPRLTGMSFATMVAAAAQSAEKRDKFVVNRTLTVRLDRIRPDSFYDDVGRIVDAAVAGGAVGAAEAQPWSGMISQGELVTFGVNDPKALRVKAIAAGLAQARELAEVIVAAQPGRKLGPVTAVTVVEPDNREAMAVAAGALGPPEAGKAVARVSMSVTFQLQ